MNERRYGGDKVLNNRGKPRIRPVEVSTKQPEIIIEEARKLRVRMVDGAVVTDLWQIEVTAHGALKIRCTNFSKELTVVTHVANVIEVRAQPIGGYRG